MVFVVVEEPRGKERFGSRVAGPAAEAILVEGLGLTRQGAIPSPDLVEGFGASLLTAPRAALEPWRDGG